MKALDNEVLGQMDIIDSLTTPRVTETSIGPRPNDRYKYLDYLPEEILSDTDFLVNLIIKDHEVFHHLPKNHQKPIKRELGTIINESQDVEFFFTVFNYATDEARNNFMIACVAGSPTFSYLYKFPESLITIDLLLNSVEAVKKQQLNHGDESFALETLYTLALDKVINSKQSENEKKAKIEEIEKHRQENALA
jgi:hypothetical protein